MNPLQTELPLNVQPRKSGSIQLELLKLHHPSRKPPPRPKRERRHRWFLRGIIEFIRLFSVRESIVLNREIAPNLHRERVERKERNPRF